MKVLVNILRFLTGALFVFSGLIKAIDPKGLAYKMQEFFEAWGNDGVFPSLMNNFSEHALSFSIIMISLEVAVGIALLLGWKKKITLWLLLLLILFFTFLTSYVLFTGKIRACGCFGDCIALTPIQTFSKDIILLLFIVILFASQKFILPLTKPFFSILIFWIFTLSAIYLQFYVLKHLPVIDCLPYKKGNDILKLREMPEDAVPDKFDYVFVYEKNGEKKEFPMTALPDSTWTFVDRKQQLIQKGKNNVPLINDFSFSSASGNDTTEAILGQTAEYYLFFMKDKEGYPTDWSADKIALEKLLNNNKKVFLITAQRTDAAERLNSIQINSNKLPVFTCDGTAIKTAARSNPTIYKMNGSVVAGKWGWADFDKIN